MTVNEIVADIIKTYSNSQVIILPCGNVGAGKSTLVRKLIEAGFPVFAVDVDSIVSMLYSGNYTKFDESLLSMYHKIKDQAIQVILSTGKSVIIDGTNCTKIRRLEYIGLAEQLGIPLITVSFGPGKEDHLWRRIKEGRGYEPEKWVGIFNHFKKSFEEPNELDEWISRAYQVSE